MFDQAKIWYRALPEKKKYVEFLSAVLSIPVLVTVILINVNNLTPKPTAKQAATADPTSAPAATVLTFVPVTSHPEPSPTPAPTEAATISPTCDPGAGNVAIRSPQDHEVVTGDHVCIMLATEPGHCPLTWSYSLNGASWSPYTDREICLYNLARGEQNLAVKVRSDGGQETTLQKTFLMESGITTPTASASSSASVQ